MHPASESLPQDMSFTKNSVKLMEIDDAYQQLHVRTNSLFKSGRLLEAYSFLLEISTSPSSPPEIFTKLGHLAYKLQKPHEAESFYFKSLNSPFTEHHSQNYFGLGQIYFQQKNYPKCISAFINVLTLSPDFEYLSLCYVKLAFCHFYLKNYAQSFNYAEKSLEKKDLNNILTSEVICLLGCIQTVYGDNLAVFEYFEKAAGLCRTFRTATCLAWKLVQTDPAKALFLCNKMCEDCKIEEIIEYKFIKAVSFVKLQKWRKAQILLEMIQKDFPYNYIYAVYLALACYYLEEYTKALEVLGQVMKTWQFKLEVLIPAYVIAGKAGKNSEAMEFYMKAYGILCIHGFGALEIAGVFMNAVQSLPEPKFSLLDLPLSKNPEYANGS